VCAIVTFGWVSGVRSRAQGPGSRDQGSGSRGHLRQRVIIAQGVSRRSQHPWSIGGQRVNRALLLGSFDCRKAILLGTLNAAGLFCVSAGLFFGSFAAPAASALRWCDAPGGFGCNGAPASPSRALALSPPSPPPGSGFRVEGLGRRDQG
jgi:hypothetical protein